MSDRLIFEEVEFGHYRVRFNDEITKAMLVAGITPEQIRSYLDCVLQQGLATVLKQLETNNQSYFSYN